MSCSSCCCGTKSSVKKMTKNEKLLTKQHQPLINEKITSQDKKQLELMSQAAEQPQSPPSAVLIKPKKSRSISWECLPFTSKKAKHNSKAAKKNKKKSENQDQEQNEKLLTNESIDQQQAKQKLDTNNNNKNKVELPISRQIDNVVMIDKYQQNIRNDQSIVNTNNINIAINKKKLPTSTSSTTTNMPVQAKLEPPQQPEQAQKQHQPYATSLVNSGFGFGFDLQGGDLDNQLTFIVNVQNNGDAARKGLQDGDILVSIQGKNVIGIRRVAIERILKQYKVDQEIEIVVCRLKDPTYILNLTNKIPSSLKIQSNSNNSNNSTQSIPIKDNSNITTINLNNNSNNSNSYNSNSNNNNNATNLNSGLDTVSLTNSAKYRSLNEQIFNELISFQDTIFNQNSKVNSNNSSLTNSSRSSQSSSRGSNMNKSIANKSPETPANDYQPVNNFVSEARLTGLKGPNQNYQKTKQQIIESTRNLETELNENLISIELNPNIQMKSGNPSISSSSSTSHPNHSQTTTSKFPINNEVINTSKPSNNTDDNSITLRTNVSNVNRRGGNVNSNKNVNSVLVTNSGQYLSDSGFGDMNRKSNKSSYYSDVSIFVYDNIGGNSNVGSAGSGMASSKQVQSSNSDVVVVSVTQQQAQQFYHPQIQPMHLDHFNSQFVPKNMLPITLAQTKASSVNDFTGSILAADRVNYYNRHQKQQSDMNKRSSSNANEMLYSNVNRKDRQNIVSNEAYIYLQSNPSQQQQQQQQQPQQQQQHISIINTVNTDNNIPSKMNKQSYDTYRDAIINKKRSASEQYFNTNQIDISSEITYEKSIDIQNVLYIKKPLNESNNLNVNSSNNNNTNIVVSATADSNNKKKFLNDNSNPLSVIEDSIEINKNERIEKQTTSKRSKQPQQQIQIRKANEIIDFKRENSINNNNTNNNNNNTFIRNNNNSNNKSNKISTPITVNSTLVGVIPSYKNTTDEALLLSSSSASSSTSSSSSLIGQSQTQTSIIFSDEAVDNQTIIDNLSVSPSNSYLNKQNKKRFNNNNNQELGQYDKYSDKDNKSDKTDENNSFEIPISIQLEANDLKKNINNNNNNNNYNQKPSAKLRYKTELTPITSVASIDQTASSTSFEIKKKTTLTTSSVSSSSTSISSSLITSSPSKGEETFEQSFNCPSSIDIEIFNPVSSNNQSDLQGANQPPSLVIMPRASRKKEKPFNIPCNDPSVSIKQIPAVKPENLNNNPVKVSLSLAVTSPPPQLDEEMIESDLSQKTTTNRNSSDRSLRYSDLSIKFIDETITSAPLSPENYLTQDLKTKFEVKPHDPKSSESIETLTPQINEIERKNNICLIEVNKNNLKINLNENVEATTANIGTATPTTPTNPSTITTSSSNSSLSVNEKTKKRKHNRFQHGSSQELVKSSLTTDNILESNASSAKPHDTEISAEPSSTTKSNKKSRRDRRNRHTIPIATQLNEENLDKQSESMQKKTKSQDSLIGSSTSSSDDEKNNQLKKSNSKSKLSSFARRETFKKSVEKMKLSNESNQEEIKSAKNETVLEPQIVQIPSLFEVDSKIEEKSKDILPDSSKKDNDNLENDEVRRKVIEWANQSIEEESESKDDLKQTDVTDKRSVKSAEEIEDEAEADIEDAFKSGCDNSMQESNDEDSLIKKKFISKKLSIFTDDSQNINIDNFESIKSPLLANKGSESASKISDNLEFSVLNTSETDALVSNKLHSSGAKSDTESALINKANLEINRNRLSIGSNTGELVTKSLRKQNDSTDTLDSASSYEIRFERPNYSSNFKQKQQSMKEKIEEKNAQWNLLIKLDSQVELKKSDVQSRESQSSSVETESENSSKGSTIQEDNTLNQIIEIVKTEETTIKTENKDALTEDFASPSYNSCSFSCSTEIGAHNTDQQITKQEESIEQKLNEPSVNPIDTSNFESSSSEFSPRFKDQNESIENDNTDMVNSSIIGNSIEENVSKLDEPSISNKNEANIEMKLDQTDSIYSTDSVHEIKKIGETFAVSKVISALIPSVNMDDGYGSTASLKQTTNESCSSIDDSELSVSSMLSSGDIKKAYGNNLNKDIAILKNKSLNSSDILESSCMENQASGNEILEVKKVENEPIETINIENIVKNEILISEKLEETLEKVVDQLLSPNLNSVENTEDKLELKNILDDVKGPGKIEIKEKIDDDIIAQSINKQDPKLDIQISLSFNVSSPKGSDHEDSEIEQDTNIEKTEDIKSDIEYSVKSDDNENELASTSIIESDKEEKEPESKAYLDKEIEPIIERVLQEESQPEIEIEKQIDEIVNQSSENQSEIELIKTDIEINNQEIKLEPVVHKAEIKEEQPQEQENTQVFTDIQKEQFAQESEEPKNKLEPIVETIQEHKPVIELAAIVKKEEENIPEYCAVIQPEIIEETIIQTESIQQFVEPETTIENIVGQFEPIENQEENNVNLYESNNKQDDSVKLDKFEETIDQKINLEIKDIVKEEPAKFVEIKAVEEFSVINEAYVQSIAEETKVLFEEPNKIEIKTTPSIIEVNKKDDTVVPSQQVDSNKDNETKFKADVSEPKDLSVPTVKTLPTQPKIKRKSIDSLNEDDLIPPIYSNNNNSNKNTMSKDTSKQADNTGISTAALDSSVNNIDLTPIDSSPIDLQQQASKISINDEKKTEEVQISSSSGNIKTHSTTTTIVTTTRTIDKPKSVEYKSSSQVTSSQEPSRNTIVSKDTVGSPVSSSIYKSNIAPRNTVISRRTNTDRAPVIIHNSTYTTSSTLAGNAISLRPNTVQSAAGMALKESRQKEKEQLSELNDRFASYVERVRFLEAQNKKLQMELDILRSKWGSETKQIEKMYQIELEEARNVLNDTAKLKDGLQLKLDKSERDLEVIRKKYTDLENHLANDKNRISSLQDQILSNESEIGLLRRRLNDLQDEEKRLKQETIRMMGEVQRVSSELENEMKHRLMLENDKQMLEEELLFIKEVHAKELEELKHLALKDHGIDPAQYFKNELASAIRQIREEYETLNISQRNELERWYRIKVSEIQRKNAKPITDSENETMNREQAKKLKTQVNESKRNICDLKAKNAELECRIKDLEEEIKREEVESSTLLTNKEHEIKLLRDDLQKIMIEYDDLVASKSDLEIEIRTYRRLLEGEENKDGLRQIVENIEQRHQPTSTAAITSSSMNSGYQSDRDTSSPLKTRGVTNSASASKLNKSESSPRKFGFLPSSRSHDEDIGSIKKKNESPIRRSIMEANEADDSSAAEDVEDRSKPYKHVASTLKEAEDYGEVQLTVTYDTNKNKLLIKINQARGLINTDKDSLSDPYVRILLVPDRKKRSKRKTKIIKDSLTPQWDETFEYDLLLSEAKTKSIDLVVKNDKSLFSREKTFMGQCLISLDSMTNIEAGCTEWYKLQDQTVFESLIKKIQE